MDASFFTCSLNGQRLTGRRYGRWNGAIPVIREVDLIREGTLLLVSGSLSALITKHPRYWVQDFGPGFVFGLFFGLLHSNSAGHILLYALLGALAYFVAVWLGAKCLRSEPHPFGPWKTWSIALAGGLAGASGAFSLASALPLLGSQSQSTWAIARVVGGGALAGAVFLLAQAWPPLRRTPSIVSGALLFSTWQAAVAIGMEQSMAPIWGQPRSQSLELTLSTVILPLLGLIAALVQILDFFAPQERKRHQPTLD